MDFKKILRSVELFDGLTDAELNDMTNIFKERQFQKGEVLAKQGSPGDELFVVVDGFAEISIEDGADKPSQVVVNLGSGQIIGEMSLVDQGPRSATVRALSDPTIVQVVRHDAFERFCDQNTRVGYIVMRNIAADLSFKLRQRHLSR